MKEWQPDLILLDIVMPKMNGFEFLEKMSVEDIKIPVIIISNSGESAEIEKTMELGAVDCLIKTKFDPNEVISKVKEYYNKKIVGKEKKHILLVEDEPMLRKICSRKLCKNNYKITQAADGDQALIEVKKNPPDLILLDIILPTINGFEVIDRIRKNPDEKINKIPIIVLSNLGQEDEIKQALSLGANRFLIKSSFNPGEILKQVVDFFNSQ